jgi:AcrR family transcriptional regulator
MVRRINRLVRREGERVEQREISDDEIKHAFTQPGQPAAYSAPGALYRHFKNKTEILKSVLVYFKSELKTELSLIINSNSTTGKEKIKSIINFQFNHFNNNPSIVMVIFSETSFQYDTILSKTVAEIMQQKKAVVDTIINNGQQDNSIRNDIEASQLTDIIMGSMRFTILRWRLSNFESDLIIEGKKLWETIELLIKKS